MSHRRRNWKSQLTPGEQGRGWVLFLLYLFVFPLLMGTIQRLFSGELPVAEANVIYYALCTALVFVSFRRFLRKSLDRLLDRLWENLVAFVSNLILALVLQFVANWLPCPVENPNIYNYAEQYALSPRATMLIVIVFLPLVEEVFFRGLLFGSLRRFSRTAAYLCSAMLFSLFCVWQFVFTYQGMDLRYLALAAQYLPMALALCRCYDAGGSIWTPFALHAVLNARFLFAAAG